MLHVFELEITNYMQTWHKPIIYLIYDELCDDLASFPSIPSIGSGSTASLTRMKPLLKKD